MEQSIVVRTVNPEQLGQSERNLVNEALRLSETSGTLVGALLGSEGWDIRPLVMLSERVYLVRSSAPALNPAGDELRRFRGLMEQISAVPALKGTFQLREQGGRIWYRRLFAQKTLAEAIDPFAGGATGISREAVVDLLSAMSQLHLAGAAHGHLSMSNIGMTGGVLSLLDIGFGASGITGEVRGVLSRDDDLMRMGELLQHLLERSMTEFERLVVRRLGSENPAERPSLSEVAQVFREQRSRAEAPPGPLPDAAPVSSGRILKMSPPPPRPIDIPPPPTQQQPKPHRPPAVAPKNTVAPSAPHSPAVASKSSVLVFLAPVVVIAIAIGAYWQYRKPAPEPATDPRQLQQQWTSDDPVQMGLVVREAMNNPDSPALGTIVADIRTGRRPPHVRADLLTTGFDPRWASGLNLEDRQALLTLAAGDLIDAADRKLPPIEKLHPGIILAISASMPMDRDAELLRPVSIDQLSKLPPPVGPAFGYLGAEGVKSAADGPARALAHLFIGDANVPTVEAYFVKSRDVSVTKEQLRFLVPLLKESSKSDEPLLEYLKTLSGDFANVIDWFDVTIPVDWTKTPRRDRLALMIGGLPETQLSMDHYIDLLTFPIAETREAARAYLGKNHFSKAHRGMVLVLSSDANRLSRVQSLLLMSSMQIPDEQAFAFYQRWFESQPNIETVFLLLLARSKVPRPAPFDVEAARYLIDREWKATTDELAVLSEHPEALARALAYAKLDPRKPAQRKILMDRMKGEPNERMKEQVRQKLELAGGS